MKDPLSPLIPVPFYVLPYKDSFKRGTWGSRPFGDSTFVDDCNRGHTESAERGCSRKQGPPPDTAEK